MSAPTRRRPADASGARVGVVQVLTWNVQRARAARASRQASWLAASAADLLVLTEVSGGRAGDHLATELATHGYRTLLSDSAGDARVLLACRTGLLRPADAPASPVLPHRFAAATWTTGQATVGVAGLYVPSRGSAARRNVDKRAFQTAVAALLPTLPTRFPAHAPILVAGDLNVVEPNHHPHHGVFGRWEYDFYRCFAESGLTDVFRHCQPHAVDHSWFGRSGAGYRFDHIFCTAAHLAAVTGCRYLHQPRTTGLSDHAAMAFDLNLPALPPA